MAYFQDTTRLTHAGVMAMLTAAIAQAELMGQPQCIVIVDASGTPLGEIRMTGARFLSRKSAMSKALTAASIGSATENIPDAVRTGLGLATQGAVTGLKGGFAIRIKGELVGGIGVGSGTGDQDAQVARAALAAVGADTPA